MTEHRTKVITSIGGSIARKSALASAPRIQKQKSHSLSLVTTSVFPAKRASPRFGIRPAGHGGRPGLPRSPGRHPPDRGGFIVGYGAQLEEAKTERIKADRGRGSR